MKSNGGNKDIHNISGKEITLGINDTGKKSFIKLSKNAHSINMF